MEYKRNLRVGVEDYTDDELSLDVYGNVNVSGNISVAGTVTYDDVINVDSIGIITARTGINVLANGINVSGVSTFQSHVHLGDYDELRFGASNDFKIVHDPNDCRFENSNGDIKFKNTGSYFFFDEDGGETLASFINDGAANLFHSGNKKLETTSAGINVTGHTETDTLNVSGVTTVNSLQVTTFSTFNGNTKHFDGKYANFGNSTDLQIVHDGSNSVIQNATGQFFIDNNASGGDLFLRANDNVVIRADGNDTVLTAQTGGIDVTGHTETDTLNVSGVSTLGTLQVSNDVNVVGVLTAERLYSNVFGEFTGGGISGTNIVGTSLSISGISTLGTLQISSGIVTATSGIITYYGDGSGLTNTNFNGASKSVVKYIATDGQTTFVASYELGYVDVYLNGVKLTADLYTSTSGTSIILNDGAAANDVIEIISFTFIEPSEADSANNIANKASSKYTATDGQTSFAATYEIGYVDVYLNGVKLTDDLYDATSGSAVILNDGAAAGDIVEIIAFTFQNFNVGIQSGGSLVGSAKTINFNGSGISSVTVSSGIATINIEGSSSGINPIVANIVF